MREARQKTNVFLCVLGPLSCVFLMGITRLLRVVRFKWHILFAFGALPTMVFLGSITLKESHTLLFFMMSAFFGIKMQMKGGINSYFIPFLLSTLGMGIMHRGLVGYALFLVALFSIWNFRPTTTHWIYIKKIDF